MGHLFYWCVVFIPEMGMCVPFWIQIPEPLDPSQQVPRSDMIERFQTLLVLVHHCVHHSSYVFAPLRRNFLQDSSDCKFHGESLTMSENKLKIIISSWDWTSNNECPIISVFSIRSRDPKNGGGTRLTRRRQRQGHQHGSTLYHWWQAKQVGQSNDMEGWSIGLSKGISAAARLSYFWKYQEVQLHRLIQAAGCSSVSNRYFRTCEVRHYLLEHSTCNVKAKWIKWTQLS